MSFPRKRESGGKRRAAAPGPSLSRGLLACAFGACLAVAVSAANAQQSVTVGALDFARAAIEAGNYAAARAVLESLLATAPGDVEANFLLAETDLQENKLDAAIARFRRLLLDHPDLIRVRLDYALALFRAGLDDNADYNFRLALAANLPETVRANVMQYLRALRARRRYQVSVTAAIAPDTNINTGTGLSEITLFGLPFTPSEQLKRKSGIGATVELSGEYKYPLADSWRLRSNASLWRTDYPGGRFDDMILRTELGPQVLLGDWEASLLGVYTQRWYGNRPFDTGAGPRVELAYHGFERWRIESDVEYLRLGYHTESFQNGDYVSTNLYPNFALSPSALLHPILGFYRQLAQDPAFADTGYRIGLGYHQELPLGLTLELQAELFLTYYDGSNALFGTTRRDRTTRLQFGLSRRDLLVFGFNPVFAYIYTQNDSNQDLFAYRRSQFTVGFTKEF
jgi:hypothetical protein